MIHILPKLGEEGAKLSIAFDYERRVVCQNVTFKPSFMFKDGENVLINHSLLAKTSRKNSPPSNGMGVIKAI